MIKSKLIALLQTFTAKEIKRFVEYSQSPYFNKSKNLSRFCELLANASPYFDEKKVEKTLLYKQVFGKEKPYHDATMRNLISDAMQLAEGFLFQENMTLAPVRQELAIAQELVMRNVFSLAEKKITAIAAELKQLKPTDGYYYEWCLHYDRLTDYLYYKQQDIGRRNAALQQKMDNLFCHFWTFTLRLYAVMRNLQYSTTACKFDLQQMDAALQLFKPDKYAHELPVLADYYAACLSHPDAGWDVFLDLYNFLKQNRPQLNRDSLININVYLTNYLHRNGHIHNQANQIRMELYLDNVAMHEQRHEKIPAWLFDNITDIGYWVFGEAWVLQFIDNYQHHLLPDVREGWLMFAQARICFNRGNFTDAIAMLSNNTPFHEQYYFYVKPLLLYAYYQADNEDAFAGLLDSVKHTLARRQQELPPLRYTALKNTLVILPKLYKLRHRFNAQLLAALQTELEENVTARYHSKSWLQQQFAAIKLKHKKAHFQKTSKE